jgi:solute:Na+ symporter, SSS family
MISFWDYVNIGFYFAFVAGVGFYFARRSKNTSDYFRGGGIMPWWVTGASAWMAAFSAWTFVGAAGKIYQTGLYVLCLYYAGVVPLLVLLFYTSYRFRRMRVVTPIEAIRLRFGAVSQQFYTWIRLPILIIMGGISLNAISVFTSAVFGFDVGTVLVAIGIVVTLMAILAGSIGVVASDFVQMFLLVAVTVTIAILALGQPQVGGLSGLFAKAPAQHFNWGEFARPGFIVFWTLALTVTKVFEQNNIEGATKFIMARSDSHARKMLIIPLLGTLFGPLIWVVPPMAAAITNPNLATQYPQLQMPQEAAFLATATNVMPVGMLGLLISALFAAALPDISGNLNIGAGIFVRNFYLPLVDRHASERKLLNISKVVSGLLGVLMIGIGLFVLRYRTLGLFDLVNQVAVSLALPMAVPAFLGLFYKRTPPWSTWSSAIIGLTTAYIVRFWVTPDMFAWLPGFAGPYKPEEVTNFYIIATVVIVGGICMAWFFFTSLFYERSSPEHKASVEEFFQRLRTPVETRPNEEEREDQAVGNSIGKLSLIYGGFVALLALIPNSLQGRLCFIGVGGVMILLGVYLWLRHRTGKAPMLSGHGTETPESVQPLAGGQVT